MGERAWRDVVSFGECFRETTDSYGTRFDDKHHSSYIFALNECIPHCAKNYLPERTAVKAPAGPN